MVAIAFNRPALDIYLLSPQLHFFGMRCSTNRENTRTPLAVPSSCQPLQQRGSRRLRCFGPLWSAGGRYTGPYPRTRTTCTLPSLVWPQLISLGTKGVRSSPGISWQRPFSFAYSQTGQPVPLRFPEGGLCVSLPNLTRAVLDGAFSLGRQWASDRDKCPDSLGVIASSSDSLRDREKTAQLRAQDPHCHNCFAA